MTCLQTISRTLNGGVHHADVPLVSHEPLTPRVVPGRPGQACLVDGVLRGVHLCEHLQQLLRQE